MKHPIPDTATMVETLANRAALWPDRPAYVVGDERISYGELAMRARATAQALAARGLIPGERCALVLPTGLDLVRAIYSVQLAGAAPVVLNPALAADALARRIGRLRCRLAVASGALVEALGRTLEVPVVPMESLDGVGTEWTPPRVTPEDVAYVQVTSGTSGEPKGVLITHRNLIATERSSLEFVGIDDDDRLVSWLPIHHDFGLVRFVFGALYYGAPAWLLQPSLLNLEAWLQTIARVRGTLTASPDFGYRVATRMVEPGLDLSSMRIFINGGEPVRMSTVEGFERRFGVPGKIRPGYGLAEATLGVTGTPEGEPLRRDPSGQLSCGRAVPGIELKVIGQDGAALPAGQRGELAVRGEVLFAGYIDDPALTADVLRDGWLLTGDLASLDTDGYLYVHGRLRNMIKTAGATLAPREAEEAADAASGVRFSAAVGLPDLESGTEALVIVSEVRPELAATPVASRDVAREVVQRVQAAVGIRPARVLLVRPRTVPVTHNGKIRHHELRDTLLAGGVPLASLIHEQAG